MSRYIPFVEIYRTQDHIEAELIKGILENESINSILKSHVVRYLYPFTVDGLGEVRILVPEDRLKAAKEIIREYKFGTDERNIHRIK
jgi:hypothetical protein